MIRQLLISAIVATLCLTATAGDFTAAGIDFRLSSSNGEAVVTDRIIDGVNSYSGVVIIPPAVYHDGRNYTVAGIDAEAFAYSHVTDVVIPNTVTRIGDAAFVGASDLVNVTLSLNLTAIPKECFAETAIENICIPEGVRNIGYGAFQSCTLLHTVMLPSTLKKIDSYAFENCHNLYEIYCAATRPPRATAWGVFAGVKTLDVVVPDNDARARYEKNKVWGNDDRFLLYPAEDFATSFTELPGDAFNQDWLKVPVGDNLAYKVFDENDELVAVTAASSLFLPASDHDMAYVVVPTTMTSDADPITVTVPAATGINRLVQDEFPSEPEPIIVAHSGTLYVYGDNYRRWTYVYDMSGRLYYQRISSDAQIIDLPRNRVYVVKVGNYVKKIFI